MRGGQNKIILTDEFLKEKGHTQESYAKLSRGAKWSVRNREKHKKMCRASIDKNPEHYAKRGRKYQLKKKYGLSIEEYNIMVKDQKGCCAICGKKGDATGKWKKLVVDHNHTTGNIRGLLCNECNRALGYFKANIDSLTNAINYLKTQKERKNNKK